MLLSRTVNSSAQKLRAGLIPAKIQAKGTYDVVVFNEAFDNASRDILIKGMKEIGYPYTTRVVDKTWSLEDGGVFIQSRLPIVDSAMIVYDSGTGTDNLAAKGAIYAKFILNGQNIYVFGTHLQADRGSQERAVRADQLRELSVFISNNTGDARETGGLILIAGDLNICAIQDQDELQQALETLRADFIAPRPNDYTSNPSVNTLGKLRYPGVAPEWLDYILASRRGVIPTEGSYEVMKYRASAPYDISGTEQLDLSDHYGLAASISMRTDQGTGPEDWDEPLI